MRLVIIGYGYSSRAVHRFLKPHLDAAFVTCRTEAKAAVLAGEGLTPIVFDGEYSSDELDVVLCSATHLLVSAAPGKEGDPFLRWHGLENAERLKWVGYLSTVGVYGNHDGGWVDEKTTPVPVSTRSVQRVSAEQRWRNACHDAGVALGIFRLSGIYGPGRSALDKVRAGTARRLVKPGQVFNRIHVEDIGRVVAQAAMSADGGIFNVTDDEPAPPQDVITHAAKLVGVEPPEEQDFETAELSPMARSFYGENKRVSNAKIKAAYGPMLFPTYREGLAGLLTRT